MLQPKDLHKLTNKFELPVIGGIQVEWLEFDGCRWLRDEDETNTLTAYLRWWDGTQEGYCVQEVLTVAPNDTPEAIHQYYDAQIARMRRLIEKGALPDNVTAEPSPEA